MAESAEVNALREQIAALQLKLDAKEKSIDAPIAPYSASYQRTMIKDVLEAPGSGASLIGKTLRIGGWVRTGRVAGGGSFAFLNVNDGSCFGGIQVMVEEAVVADREGGLKSVTGTGSSILVEGEIAASPEGKEQVVELKAKAVIHVGGSEGKSYPMAKKKQSPEFLREKAHLRPRTNLIGAVARIRNALAFATHRFFQSNGFLYVHTPLITCSDCEGAGEMFQVTTLLNDAEKVRAALPPPEKIAELKAAASAQGSKVKDAKTALAADKENAELKAALAAELKTLKEAKDALAEADQYAGYQGGVPFTKDGKSVDYTKDFFGSPAYLTVSGQLNGEYYACSLSNVYTFGPTFRAENSHTSRHLSEFWMIEPEIAFCDLEDDMKCAEDYVRFCARYLLDTCPADLQFMVDRVDKTCIERLEQVASTPFVRCDYTRAIELLEKAVAEGKEFENEVSWGIDLASEHERFLTEEIFKSPTIVYNYPKEIKAFYMKLNPDGKTVAAMDVLVPRVGELVGGSQREDDLELLKQRTIEAGMELEPYEGYFDLRKYGNVPHSGFGLGFERLILFATGIPNIRDVIPFPRWPGNAKY